MTPHARKKEENTGSSPRSPTSSIQPSKSKNKAERLGKGTWKRRLTSRLPLLLSTSGKPMVRAADSIKAAVMSPVTRSVTSQPSSRSMIFPSAAVKDAKVTRDHSGSPRRAPWRSASSFRICKEKVIPGLLLPRFSQSFWCARPASGRGAGH